MFNISMDPIHIFSIAIVTRTPTIIFGVSLIIALFTGHYLANRDVCFGQTSSATMLVIVILLLYFFSFTPAHNLRHD